MIKRLPHLKELRFSQCFLLVFKVFDTMLMQFIIHLRKVLSDHSEARLIIIVELCALRLTIIIRGLVNLGFLLIIYPGDAGADEIPLELSLLITIDFRFAPSSIDEGRACEVAY